MATQQLRARVEWPDRVPLTDVMLDLEEDGPGWDVNDWHGSFPVSMQDIVSVNEDAREVRIALEDGRSGRAITSLREYTGGPPRMHFLGLGPLE